MKKVILTAISILFMTFSYAQANFKWDKIDSIAKNKNELYSLTKMYIGETWKSAQNVIQNDDKEGGMVTSAGEIVVYNVEGQVVATASQNFNVNSLAEGVYFITAQEGVIKFVK